LSVVTTTPGFEKENVSDKIKPPTDSELEVVLGGAHDLWNGIVSAVETNVSPLNKQWKPSKAEFGRICLLQHKGRTLLYMTPDKEKILIAVVLGERAAAVAANSKLPVRIKRLITAARPYAEGRGIRFPVSSSRDIPIVTQLVTIKTGVQSQKPTTHKGPM
jgi:Protein of unknown function (DUF3788)